MPWRKERDYIWYIHPETDDTNVMISEVMPGETSYPRECFDYDYKKKQLKKESSERHLWGCEFHLIEHLMREKIKAINLKYTARRGEAERQEK
jgi:hypothetical protein